MGSYADAAAFRNAAVNGQLGVDPDAAQAVLKKIRLGKDQVENLLRNAGALAEPPKLGNNPVGNAIAAKFVQRADGGGESYATALRNLYNQYQQAEDAIVAAMSHYDKIEQAAEDALASGRQV
ncbi:MULTISPECIES: hypothetical protein [Amycolatopsis]|uniref:PE domain-containing protein n=3 Tax=Amycolatopsis TaxID=1813 RepID=A0A3N2GYC2_9PSEU|nr:MULTISPECIES: hypothetical protein [Amycolatopsis]MCF6427306.1 hypothetical protein [Amycolatopsis tucumanensis]OXM72177.1 hypothetical protein CF166_16555 [Amycolatopsis sp. KNN50.9b]ROS41613.1 hypothetical protein EDD35_3980 [Amycolatopsis thermoflava]UQS27640.1 hypothetical protein L1857_34995 [Amycolatopsis thermalba]